jgi:dTDP-4-dehydrorhamnose reductase
MPASDLQFSKIAILGANGQVGRALVEQLGAHVCIPLTRLVADLARPTSVVAALRHYQPQAVINAAAYTQVDQAEKEESVAATINAEAPRLIAQWCAGAGVPMIHYSTDYVFSGEGETPWREDDRTGPLSAYGRSKLAGERAIVEAGGRHLIFRTSWVYDETGKNFLRTMLRLGAERETLRVVADQFGAPTYAGHLANATIEALGNALKSTQFPSGIYHLANRGETTWHGFATAIFVAARERGRQLAVTRVEPIET